MRVLNIHGVGDGNVNVVDIQIVANAVLKLGCSLK